MQLFTGFFANATTHATFEKVMLDCDFGKHTFNAMVYKQRRTLGSR